MNKYLKLNNAAGVLCFDLYVCGVLIKQDSLAKLTDVNDSKKLSEKKRAELFPKIIELAVDYEIVRMTPHDKDKIVMMDKYINYTRKRKK